VKVDLIRIGNSRGVRIPKPILKQCGFGRQVDMSVKDNVLMITPARAIREGWDEAFESMAVVGDDAAHFPDEMYHGWDEAEWEW
jgi:antitoxin MazE